MNVLQFSRRENRSNRRLQSRRRPMVEGLEGRQLLSGLSAGKVSVVADVQKVREAAVIIQSVADVQKAREAAITNQGARDGTNVANPDVLFPVFAQSH